jgi:hypothetical protein
MNDTPEKVSSATPLEKEDQEALDRVNGSAHQGAAPFPPTAEGSQGSSAVPPTPQSVTFAGHITALVNEFFVRRFGPDKALSGALLDAIKQDTALALDTYFPNVETKPGVFAALALGGHFIACQRQARQESATQSALSAKAEPAKPPFSNTLSESERES